MKYELTKKDIKKLILRNRALLTFDEGLLLYNLAKECNGDIVEIGSYKGGSTIILAKGLKEPYKVYAVDPHNLGKKMSAFLVNGKKMEKVPENTFFIFEKNLAREKVREKVVPIINISEKAIKNWNKKIGILWIDGNHEYIEVKKDFLLWEPFLKKNGIIVFHDSVVSRNKSPILQVPTGTGFSGPGRIIKEFVVNSDKFKDINLNDSITYARKKNDTNIIEKLNYRIDLIRIRMPEIRNKYRKLNICLDNMIGLVGLKIKKFFPHLYKLIKIIKS